ncbi:aminopeptidase P N-terminal domain-containing protein [Granulicella tundricola]|uniref:Xaa-Pro aminopeptidase n=1 Tax=Granulicella tundricola (strain ATCC BAA-1859 / DSM 23138 / MP5ACTX9) TaxID=1198114 RepID=E8X6E6_GRATM|nr:aminopeptidase P N-terminal domain-containing protein [Granulicella tundricola]ADW71030.1 peptidase M24 [Granulicella tundricola MP5ACTX9]
MTTRLTTLLTLLFLALAFDAAAQPVRNSFPPEEFAARRAHVFEKIGDGIAILEGTTERPGEQPFRQGNQFYYLTGVSEARAIALLDGRTKETTIFLLPLKALDVDSKYGPGALYPGDDSARTSGVTRVLPREELTAMLAPIAREGRTIYTPFRPEVLGSASSYDTLLLTRLNHDDPWDGRFGREEAFRLKLMTASPKSEIRDLDPIVDELRAIKSEREIAVLREATRIADRGILRAMHAAKPGLYEYQLQAESEYEFKRDGAYGPAYFALVATGKNTWYTHYHYDTAQLAPGDLIQYDYAPDYRNYTSDVTRIFPASGKFTAHQREYYVIYLRLYQAIMGSIQVHESPVTVTQRAVAKMDAIVAAYTFTDPAIKKAVLEFVDTFRGKKGGFLGHAVGMEVHDVYGSYRTLEPGMVFTIEPMLRLPEEHVAVRLEDMLLITPSGYENLSRSVPIEVTDIEKFMAAPLPKDLQ